MYYSYPCPVCGMVFYTFSNYQQEASQNLYNGVEKHIKDYQEENSGYDNLDHPDKMYQDVNAVYTGMAPSQEAPAGGYNLG